MLVWTLPCFPVTLQRSHPRPAQLEEHCNEELTLMLSQTKFEHAAVAVQWVGLHACKLEAALLGFQPHCLCCQKC